MPVYDYKCTDCGNVYDVFHKTRENINDVVCPGCKSANHKKLISVPSISMGAGSSPAYSPAPACESGGCCGGSCDVN